MQKYLVLWDKYIPNRNFRAYTFCLNSLSTNSTVGVGADLLSMDLQYTTWRVDIHCPCSSECHLSPRKTLHLWFECLLSSSWNSFHRVQKIQLEALLGWHWDLQPQIWDEAENKNKKVSQFSYRLPLHLTSVWEEFNFSSIHI